MSKQIDPCLIEEEKLIQEFKYEFQNGKQISQIQNEFQNGKQESQTEELRFNFRKGKITLAQSKKYERKFLKEHDIVYEIMKEINMDQHNQNNFSQSFTTFCQIDDNMKAQKKERSNPVAKCLITIGYYIIRTIIFIIKVLKRSYTLFFSFMNIFWNWIGCDCGDKQVLTIRQELEQNTYDFSLISFYEFLPLFLSTVYTLNQTYLMYFDTCYATQSSNVNATLDNFSRKCVTYGMPFKIIPGKDDYVPAFPAVSPEFQERCDGITQFIERQNFDQYLLHAQLVFILYFGVYVYLQVRFERLQKDFIQLSYKLGGIYSEHGQINKYKVRFLNGLMICLTIGYGMTLTPEIQSLSETWYIFHSQEAANAFEDQSANINYCDQLIRPVKIEYVQRDLPPFLIRLIVFIQFAKSVYSIYENQSKEFDWIDTEVLMDESKKEECSYYNFFLYRNRVFVHAQIQDFIVANYYLPLFQKILYQEQQPNQKQMIQIRYQNDNQKKAILNLMNIFCTNMEAILNQNPQFRDYDWENETQNQIANQKYDHNEKQVNNEQQSRQQISIQGQHDEQTVLENNIV